MRGVLAGFAAIWAVTAVGWVVGRLGLLDARAERVLARLVFFVLTPALLFTTLSRASPADLLTPALAAFAVSAVVVGVAGAALARAPWRGRGGGTPAAETVVAGLSASYVNAAYLGIPIAAYVLGDVSAVAPVLLFQVLLVAPVALAVLDAGGHRSGVGSRGLAPTVTRVLRLPIRNPIIIGSAAGLALAATGWRPPAEALRPVELLGSAAVPVALLALGLALAGQRPRLRGPDAGLAYALVALKAVGQPAVAYLVARYALGLSGPALLAAAVTAALPTAQNVYVFAARYERGERLARDVVLLSTLVAALTTGVLAAWLG